MDNYNPLLNEKVRSEWVDYNGHMNDAAYAVVFSRAVEALMEALGLGEAQRQASFYTIFTLETHLCYLKEAVEGENLTVTFQLLDHDAKRLHVFFFMINSREEQVAVSEQMLMGMNTKTGRPDAFPQLVDEAVKDTAASHLQLSVPEKAGRRIGIKQK
ncbi:acyl-CoA thioester hydrolase [Salibacterium halotolerans]|uniref:Acyl-CoA thioester hydrolase n=2 Tax=Salibacterium halotolerans TaxID=1884432 RepID=A0A1I5X1H9_9BACI|nr:acyl-CoA thioester hydrolase [Salibacterium halotolerans]